MKTIKKYIAKTLKENKMLKNPKGGFVYGGEESARAKNVDLITLPETIKGTNYGNCKFIKKGFCEHPSIKLPVNNRMCCALWDAEGSIRS